METWKVTIPGLLPGLNEYIDAERAVKGKYKAAAMKKQAENVIGFMVKTQLLRRPLRPAGDHSLPLDRAEPPPRQGTTSPSRRSSFRTAWSTPASW